MAVAKLLDRAVICYYMGKLPLEVDLLKWIRTDLAPKFEVETIHFLGRGLYVIASRYWANSQHLG